MRKRVTTALLLALAACAGQSQQGGGGSAGGGAVAEPGTGGAPPASGAQTRPAAGGETSNIARLEREARAIARPGPCQEEGQCRTAEVGSRPCGGPREYLVYCATTTDTVSLFAKLDSLAAAEKAYNEREGLVSTCEFRMPPTVELSGNACRVVTNSPM